ncbi:protein Shroom1 isoform X3 [Xiphophorus couchianus]|uniref:protein Shroom1 isoform X3 n=1 Tax=Xiphophorus couchianus TaxID=32473 RepID=UPI0010162FD6|nr:protein Shroom1-like isoform X3 [Xiphophorus couchianus]
MDSYSLHFERMSNVDLHPLSLSVSRLSPAKSNSSIADHLSHHQHGKGDSAYSSFSGGSTAPDYPSPFLPDDLQSSSFSHCADLKYVKSIYHPTQFLQPDSKTMDQLYRSVEAISQQYHKNSDLNYHSLNGSESLHTNNNAHPKKEVQSSTPSQSGQAPPVPLRLDSFIATKNLENSRAHLHGTEFKPLPQQPQQEIRLHGQPYSQSQHFPRSETAILDKSSSNLSSEPLYSVWRGSHEMQQVQHPPSYRLHLQLHNQTRVNLENPSIVDSNAAFELHSQSPPHGRNQPEHLTPKQTSSMIGCNGDHQIKSGGYFQSERKRAYSAQEVHGSSELQRADRPRNGSQSCLSSSIQHKGQFYFVTGVYKPSEPAVRTHSAPISGTEFVREVSAVLETHHQDNPRSHSTMDNFFRPFYESSHTSSGMIPEDEEVFTSVDQGMVQMSKSLDQENYTPPHILNVLDESREIGHHTASNPIFYCGPDLKSPPQSATHQNDVNLVMGNKSTNYNRREDHTNRGKRQPLEDIASERINKETTPLLYHLTGASRTAMQPNPDPGFSGRKEGVLNKSVQEEVAVNNNETPAQGDTSRNHRGDVLSAACGTLDDSFKKYYKEKLKDAQCKVLSKTSFKRRDLQLPLPHCLTQNSECRPAVIHSFSSSQDSEISTDTLTPSLTSQDTEKGSLTEVGDIQKEIEKSFEKKNLRLANVAQPQVARIGGRKRLTPEQKKMCFSEPEKLNELGRTPKHSVCCSFGNESEGLFAAEFEGEDAAQQAEQGLVAARREMFESRGRALSVSSASKTNLKHVQHQALVEYMERKTGQKVAEPQHPTSHLPTPSRQRHSLGEKPFDWNPRPQSWNHEKHTKKKHLRPHSAGRILDSPSSSIRYAQFFSAQSCSGHYPGHQNSSRPRESHGPPQGKSASAESLLDQRESTSFLRNRSTSTPHTFQAQDKEENPEPVSTMETQSCRKNEAEQPSEKRVAEGQQLSWKVGQRGKSMEELGASKITKVSTLSKSSEHLDQLRRNSAEPAGRSRNIRSISHFAEDGDARRQETRKEEEFVGQNNSQGQNQHQTQKHPPQKQSSEQREDATRETGSGGSVSPVSSGEPSETFSNPPSPKGQKISEWEIKSTCSTPTQTKRPCESTPVSSRSGTSPRLEREQTVDESSGEANHEVTLSCGVTTDPSLWILSPEEELQEDLRNSFQTNNVSDERGNSISTKQTSDSSVSPSMSASKAEVSHQADEQKELDLEAETVGQKEETEKGEMPEGETDSSEKSAKKPKWEELVKAVVKADRSLARVLCPLASRKTALMLMEQLLSEDTLLMEEHYKKKQEQKGAGESNEASKGAEPSPCPPDSDSEKFQCTDEQSQADITEMKHLLVSYIHEHLRSLEESRGALQTDVEENAALGEAMKLLVGERCLPVELERYNLFIGDLERVVNLLLCLSARLARVQNALSVVDQHTDAEEKESLDSRHRLLCKQREDAKDLKDNLDRRENLVSTFLSRQLSAEQLQDYRRFVQTKASLLIRQKDLEEKQRLGEEQLEELFNSLNM